MRSIKGFTLLEVLLVLVIIGFMVTALIPGIRGVDIEDELEQHSQKFSSVFVLASEYALLNNLELGLYVKDNSYQFLGFDGVRWVPISEHKFFQQVQFEPPFSIKLSLDELALEDELSLDQSLFEEIETEESFKDEEEFIYPQVYILSAGEITPFTLTFTYDDGTDLPMNFDVTGEYSIPLVIKGPWFDHER
ncbi:prepilin-type N-terminal cleavage/methylation domain-containing protein [Thalassotalea aquiviva]|uniref:prepilin-type N-terminal cleavage/methylation domain-containing protein n=1 Tax=Thalassotalea aquiviva TaxID=3242415 RepID=UPI00352B448B